MVMAKFANLDSSVSGKSAARGMIKLELTRNHLSYRQRPLTSSNSRCEEIEKACTNGVSRREVGIMIRSPEKLNRYRWGRHLLFFQSHHRK